jgi:hypothetical protein
MSTEQSMKKSKPIAERIRDRGIGPETEEGGRAMMQAITMEDIRRAEASRKMVTLKPGDQVTFTTFTVGGSRPEQGTVLWDYGRHGVSITTKSGEKVRLERAGDGSLRRFI